MVDIQLEITNIRLHQYPDDLSENLLFSVMKNDTLGNYKPITSIYDSITNMIYNPPQDMNCQTDFASFMTDQCEQVSINQLFVFSDQNIQTDEIVQEQVIICQTENSETQTEKIILTNTDTQTYIASRDLDTQTDLPNKIVSSEQQTDAVNLYTETCFNKNLDKNIIISTDYEECFHRNVIVNNSHQTCHITLMQGQEKEFKCIHLLHQNAYPVIVITQRGSFYIHSQERYKKVIYIERNKSWSILESLHNNFFPFNNLTNINHDYKSSSFGSSIAINGSGTMCTIGGITANNATGSVWIYSLINNEWMFCDELPCPEEEFSKSSFIGTSISMDYNGRTIAVGGSGNNNGIGACWLYSNNSTSLQLIWELKKKLICSNSIGKSFQGISTLISPNGKNLFISGTGDNNWTGAVWIWEKHTDDDWIEIQKITCSGSKKFGMFVATNYTGTQVAICSIDNIYIYEKQTNNQITSWIYVAQLFKPNTIQIISMSKYLGTSQLIAIVKDNINILTYDAYIFEMTDCKLIAKHRLFKECNVLFNELICCDTNDNGKTIVIGGIDENNYSVMWCFINTYDCWKMINKKLLVDYKIQEMNVNISANGHLTMFGLPSTENYTGSCFIAS